jgi:biotin carboxyl carrier protein
VKLTLVVGEEGRALRVLRRGRELEVALPDGRTVAATVDGHPDGTFTLTVEGRRLAVAGARSGAERQLWLAGRTLRYQVQAAGPRPGAAPAEAGMASAIPAVVREVLVQVGQEVAEGQKLLLLESMKMVLPVLASRAGRVRAIVKGPGDAVPPGLPLVEIEDP